MTPDRWLTLQANALQARVRVGAEDHPAGVWVLLHGWTGDEFFMGSFVPVVPSQAWAVLLRAPYPAASPRGGYSWLPRTPTDRLPAWSAYRPALLALQGALRALAARFPHAGWHRQHWMGFSQGASTAGVYALQYPQTVATVALLAGFLPTGTAERVAGRPLHGKRAFIAHGQADPIVPVRYARQARALLEAAGAQVTYCEDQAAHKVGARCRKALEQFYAPDDRSAPRE